MHTCMYVRMYTYVDSICTYVLCRSMHVRTCTYVCMYVCVYVYVCVCVT